MSMTIVDLEGRVKAGQIRPLGDYLFVRDLTKETTAGGIILPNGERSECRFAEVVAVGSGETNLKNGQTVPLDFKPGETILFMDYAGEYLELKDGRHRFLHANGVWAKAELVSEETLEVRSIRPVMDKLVVEVKEEEKTRGGILLPEDMKLKWASGLVHSVSAGYFHAQSGRQVEMDFKSGEKIAFMRYAGAIVTVGGKKLRLIQKADVLVSIEGE